MICSIYTRPDGTIAHITDGIFAITPDANTTRVIQFSIEVYPAEYQHIAAHSKAALWDGANLQIDNVVYLSAAWIQARATELDTASANKQADTSERAALLAVADNALTQIANDLTAITQGKTTAQAATTLAQMRTIILGMLDVQEHTCNRQDKEIKALRAILRNGLG